MDLATIDMPVDEARERLNEYRAALRVHRTDQDRRIAAGYRVLARGLPIIRLSESIAAGGYFANGLPRIAVVRADAKVCEIRAERWRSSESTDFIFFADDWSENRGALVGENTVRVTVPKVEGRGYHGRTIVPSIPPRHRRAKLGRYHLLWEVEAWELIAPRDPALIKHIGGDLWAVHAIWDLTELERAVLQR